MLEDAFTVTDLIGRQPDFFLKIIDHFSSAGVKNPVSNILLPQPIISQQIHYELFCKRSCYVANVLRKHDAKLSLALLKSYTVNIIRLEVRLESRNLRQSRTITHPD